MYPESVADAIKQYKLRVMHIQHGHRMGGVTLVWAREVDHKNCKMVRLATAYCHPDDTYNKKVGTEHAVARWLEDNTILLRVGKYKVTPFLRVMFQGYETADFT